MRFVVAVALLVTLSACSGEPTPKEPTSTSSVTPTPTLAAPTMPLQASEPGPEGASAFTKYWVDTLNYASNTGDVSQLEAITDDSCTGCRSYIDLYRETYAAGGYVVDGYWQISDLDVKVWPSETLLTATVSIEGGVSRQTSDHPELVDQPETEVISFGVRIESRLWKMAKLGLGEVQ